MLCRSTLLHVERCGIISKCAYQPGISWLALDIYGDLRPKPKDFIPQIKLDYKQIDMIHEQFYLVTLFWHAIQQSITTDNTFQIS